MAGKPSATVSMLVVTGMMLLVVGLTTRSRMPEQVFGLPGDYLSGIVMGLSVGVLLLAVGLGARARRG